MKVWGKPLLWIIFAALLLASSYLLNLGSAYAPTNGDEMVYLHIARMTSEIGHWLPLQSQLEHMRNTKPPLLFWQAMLAGQWGWNLFVLRFPYALETLLTAGLVGFLSVHLIGVRPQWGSLKVNAHRWMVGLLAATVYLGFFSTYRYGRPVLSSSVESLFLFGVCTFVIVKPTFWQARPVWLSIAVGVFMVPALLVKSFVLAAPVGVWLVMTIWVVRREQGYVFAFGIKDLWRLTWPAAFAVLIGVAIFSLWFVFDPDPVSVWREFVVGENFSTKFKTDSYWMGTIKGADSMWGFWLSPLVNAGLLFPLLIGLLVAAWQGLRNKSSKRSLEEKLLWLWVLAWLLVFMWPNQRSARYVIPVMPALAVLLALYADRIHRAWWMLTLGLVGVAAAALGWIAWCLNGAFPVGFGYPNFYFLSLVALCFLCIFGLFVARFRVIATVISALGCLVLLGAFAMPLEKDAGRFDVRVVQQIAGQKILVPQNFNAQFERFQFAWPTTPRVQPMPYADSQRVGIDQLLVQAPYAVILQPLHLPIDNISCIACEVLSSRLVLRSRQNPNELTWQNLRATESVQNLLLEREILVRRKKRDTVESK